MPELYPKLCETVVDFLGGNIGFYYIYRFRTGPYLLPPRKASSSQKLRIVSQFTVRDISETFRDSGRHLDM